MYEAPNVEALQVTLHAGKGHCMQDHTTQAIVMARALWPLYNLLEHVAADPGQLLIALPVHCSIYPAQCPCPHPDMLPGASQQTPVHMCAALQGKECSRNERGALWGLATKCAINVSHASCTLRQACSQ